MILNDQADPVFNEDDDINTLKPKTKLKLKYNIFFWKWNLQNVSYFVNGIVKCITLLL